MNSRKKNRPSTATSSRGTPGPNANSPPATQPTAAKRRLLIELLCVALVALAARAIYLYQMHGSLPFATLVLDGRVYDAWAQQIAAGDWLGSEVFYQAPLYPYFLASIYAVGGHDAMLVRIVQAALNVSSCLLLAWTGRRLIGPRVGLIAGTLLAIYPPALFFDSLVQKAAVDLWLMTLLLAVLAEFTLRRTWPWLLPMGALLGALTLNRENAGLMFPVLAIWIWFYLRPAKLGLRAVNVAAFAAGMALVLLPVGGRNYYVGGEFLLTTSQLGPNFYIGNHPGASGRYEPLVPHRADPRFERTDAARLAQQDAGQDLSAGQVSRYWLRRSLDYIQQQPAAWLRLMGWKLMLFANAAELIDGEGIDVYARYSVLLRVLGFGITFGVVLPLAVLGCWATRADWRKLFALYAIVASLVVSTALFYVFARYRFAVVPIALLFAAAGLNSLPEMWRAWRAGTWWPAWGLGCLMMLVAAVVCNYPVSDPREGAVTYVNLGMGLLSEQRPAEALEPLRAAIEMNPDGPGGHHNLGRALSAVGRADEAAGEYRRAIELAPDFGVSHAELGSYYFSHDEPEKALVHLQQAVRLVPDMLRPRLELAELLTGRNDGAGAARQLREGLRIDPNSWLCANNLAWLLATHPDDTVRNGNEALAVARRLAERELTPQAERLSPEHEAGMFDTLAAAYAETGNYDEATATIRRAVDLVRGGNAELTKELESRLKLYEAGQPYRQPKVPEK